MLAVFGNWVTASEGWAWSEPEPLRPRTTLRAPTGTKHALRGPDDERTVCGIDVDDHDLTRWPDLRWSALFPDRCEECRAVAIREGGRW